MQFTTLLTPKRVAIGYLCAGALVAVACADGRGIPTNPSASPASASKAPTLTKNAETSRQLDASVAASSPRSGALVITKECSAYTGKAGSFCTITSSNLKAIPAGTRVVYLAAPVAGVLNTDVVLVPPGKGKSVAYGHVTLNLAIGRGLVTVSGGTGKFKHFTASAVVTSLGRPNWAWNGTYSFGGKDEQANDRGEGDDD